MKNKLYLLLITVMACFALSACGDSDEGTKEMKTYEYDNSGDVVIENDSLKLSVSGSSTQLEVTDKATGKVYRSNPTAEDVEKYANADGHYKDVLSSTLNLTYSNNTDTKKEIDNYSQCIRDNKFYKIEKVNDNEIKVSYSVGDFEKTYTCPVEVSTQKLCLL